MNTVRYVRNPEILTADMNGETVMMHIQRGKYYSIGVVGGRVWSLLETPKSIEELAGELMKEYDVDKETCMRDIAPFIEALKSCGMIEEMVP